MVAPSPERTAPATSPAARPPPSRPSKPQRVLACVLCQQRKVKCDRKFPCANCIKFRVQCMPATLAPRRQRRRFPERELLERLRKYEDLLRQNNISFEPLRKIPSGGTDSPNEEGGYESDDEHPESAGVGLSSLSTTAKPERVYEAKNFWHAMSEGFRDPDNESDSSEDDVREDILKKAWDQSYQNNDHLLFGSREALVDLSTLHPEPVQIFRLWQIYLDNVNPLLKVTHTPSLQGRIIEAAGDVKSISPTLEALMFSIYCMSILSLTADECQAFFGSSREDLLTGYQFGCQQALLNSGFLRSSDRDCLTALYLYLVSLRPSMDPRSLLSMLGVAIRIAQRMGIHKESVYAKFTVLEAEMCRRLWWSLVLFDTRISELANSKTETLAPTWDCKVPLNANDSDLRPEMREPPAGQGNSTEALFAVVRSELGEFVRHTMFHLDFSSPALKPLARGTRHGSIHEGGELVTLEKSVEDNYLKFCDPENPLHYMTIWMTRAYLAKCRLVEHYSRYSTPFVHQKGPQRDAALPYALRMLECDTKIMTSPLTKGYLWLANFYFPFPAYIQILQDLRRRPLCKQAAQAWEVMSDNYEVRFVSPFRADGPFFKIFSKIVLQAWEPREAAFMQMGEPPMPPRIASYIRQKVAQTALSAKSASTEEAGGFMGQSIDDFQMSMPMGFGSHSLPYGMGGQDGYAGVRQGVYPNITGGFPSDVDVNQLVWAAMDWDLMNARAGGTADSTGPPLHQAPGQAATHGSWKYE